MNTNPAAPARENEADTAPNSQIAVAVTPAIAHRSLAESLHPATRPPGSTPNPNPVPEGHEDTRCLARGPLARRMSRTPRRSTPKTHGVKKGKIPLIAPAHPPHTLHGQTPPLPNTSCPCTGREKKKILLGGPESVLRRLAYFPPSRETHIGPTHVTSSLGSATSQLHSQSPDMTVPHSSSRGAYNL